MLLALDYSFHIYNLEKLRIIFMSHQFNSKIMLIKHYRDYQFTALENGRIIQWNKLRKIRTYKVDQDISEMMIINDMLIVLTATSQVLMFNIKTGMKIKELSEELTNTCNRVIHPLTYVNKMLFATHSPGLKLINIDSGKSIYDFPLITKSIDS